MPKVTIILPVYNGEKTLKATLESLLRQTFQDFELLIGIDGTTDKSKEIAQSFKDSRIKIIEHSVNRGLAHNLNALINLSYKSSHFIAMAEQDDVYVPERLQWQVEVLEGQPQIGLVSGIAEFRSENSSVLFPGLLVNEKQFPQGVELFKFLYIHQLKVVNTCMMVRKSVHHNYKLAFNDTYGNFNVDWDYILRFSLVSKIYGIHRKLVVMSRYQALKSVTTNKWQQFKASRNLLKDFRNEYPELIGDLEYNKALKEHRKIELGYRPKLQLIGFGLYYLVLYRDLYFFTFLKYRIKKYIDKHGINQN